MLFKKSIDFFCTVLPGNVPVIQSENKKKETLMIMEVEHVKVSRLMTVCWLIGAVKEYLYPWLL